MLLNGSLYFWAGVQLHLYQFCRTLKLSGKNNQQYAGNGETEFWSICNVAKLITFIFKSKETEVVWNNEWMLKESQTITKEIKRTFFKGILEEKTSSIFKSCILEGKVLSESGCSDRYFPVSNLQAARFCLPFYSMQLWPTSKIDEIWEWY